MGEKNYSGSSRPGVTATEILFLVLVSFIQVGER